MLHPTWAGDGTRRAIIVNRNSQDAGSPPPALPPSGWGTWVKSSLPPLRPSTPPPPTSHFCSAPTSWAAGNANTSSTALPPPSHFVPAPSSWGAAAGEAGSPLRSRVVYSPSASSPLLCRPGLRWPPSSSGRDSGVSLQHLGTSSTSTSSTSTSSLHSLGSSPPTESSAPRWLGAFPDDGQRHVPQQVFVESNAVSGRFGTVDLDTDSNTTIDNLAALTELMCISEERREQSFLSPEPHYVQNAMKQRRPRNFNFVCAFCKGNGELPSVYGTHRLHVKSVDGTMIVQCPVLRNLRCDICDATGDKAHTRSHCPFNIQPSVAVMLKRTPRKCDGSLRFMKNSYLNQF